MNDSYHGHGVSKPMQSSAPAYRRLQLVLDCILILLLMLIASGNRLAVRAEPNQQAAPAAMDLGMNPVAPDSSPVDAQPAPALLDDNTLAAMIAAENAALTPPLYFSDLPLIHH
jgi:hypothetical protein